MRHHFIAGLAALCLSLPTVSHANSDLSVRDILKQNTGDTPGGDCSVSRKKLKHETGLNSVLNIKGDSGKGKKTFRYYTKASVQMALDAGYNYAVMSPLDISKYRDYQEVVRYGWGTARKGIQQGAEQRAYELTCHAIDDIAASDLMWDPRTSQTLNKGALIDLRQLVATLDLDVTVPPRKRAINPRRFERPGDQERFEALYPVKAAAAACRTGMAPRGIKDFKPIPGSRDVAAELACLETHRVAAANAGWTTFPLAREAKAKTVETKGYVLNRPRSTGTVPASDGENTGAWGKGWSSLSSQISAPSGLYLYHPKERVVLLASSSLTAEQMLDLGVFATAMVNLATAKPGIGIKDVTEGYRDAFDRNVEQLRKSAAKRSERDARDRSRNADYDLDIEDSDIEDAEEDIADARKWLAEAKTGNDDEAIRQIEQTMAAFPTAEFDAAAMREQLASARALQVTMALQEIAEKEAALVKLRQDQAVEIARREAEVAQTQSELDAKPRPQVAATPSETLKTPYRKAIFLAFESYPNVQVLDTSNLAFTGTCFESMLVCADKLQVYNALVGTYGAAGDAPLAEPSNYRTYVSR